MDMTEIGKPLSKIVILAVLLACMMPASSMQVMARGASGSSTAGLTSAGSHEVSAPSAGGSGFGPGVGQSQVLRGGISSANPSRTGSSSVTFSGGTSTGFGPESSSGGGFQAAGVQQSVFASQATGGELPTVSSYGDLVNTVYGGGYAGTTGPAPAQVGSTSAQACGLPVQPAAQPAGRELFMSECTKEYTPYECSVQYYSYG